MMTKGGGFVFLAILLASVSPIECGSVAGDDTTAPLPSSSSSSPAAQHVSHGQHGGATIAGVNRDGNAHVPVPFEHADLRQHASSSSAPLPATTVGAYETSLVTVRPWSPPLPSATFSMQATVFDCLGIDDPPMQSLGTSRHMAQGTAPIPIAPRTQEIWIPDPPPGSDATSGPDPSSMLSAMASCAGFDPVVQADELTYSSAAPDEFDSTALWEFMNSLSRSCDASYTSPGGAVASDTMFLHRSIPEESSSSDQPVLNLIAERLRTKAPTRGKRSRQQPRASKRRCKTRRVEDGAEVAATPDTNASVGEPATEQASAPMQKGTTEGSPGQAPTDVSYPDEHGTEGSVASSDAVNPNTEDHFDEQEWVRQTIASIVPDPTTSMLKCPHCSYVRRHASAIKSHVLVHMPVRVRRYHCGPCNKWFLHNRDFQRHESTRSHVAKASMTDKV
ncbi:Uncharacterized protein PBTT_06172 [Plasmodiophora brassicae]